jgi:uncharacterized membrane protein HdeD (DUF308 family)
MRSSPSIDRSDHASRPILQALADRWWLFFLRGAAAVAFGVFALIWPGMTLGTLVVLYGLFAITDGIIAIVGAIRGVDHESRGWLAAVGALGIAIGAATLAWPGITSLLLLLCIAIWAIATGVAQILGALAMRHEIDDGWLLIASGALSVIFGSFLLAWPGTGAFALVFVIATFAIAFGAMLIVLALRLRKHVGLYGSQRPSVQS